MRNAEIQHSGADAIEQLTRRWNATETDYPAHRCLHELVIEQAARTPNATAVVDENVSLTYQQLVDRSAALAGWLRANGAGAESVIGVHALRSTELVVVLLGVLMAGGAYLPLDPDYPTDRLRYMVEDADVALVLVSGIPSPVWCHVPTRQAADLPTSPVLRTSERTALPDNIAYVIYTSGSTGRPKGVCVPHRGVVNRLTWMQREYRLTDHDRVLQKTPFGFDVSVWEFFWPLITGATVVMARPGGHRDTAYLISTMRREGITTAHFVPSMLAPFLDEPDVSALRLRRVVCSGEALSPALVGLARKVLPGEFHNLYGPTEASIDVTAHRCQADPTATTVPIGAPISNTQIHILDPEGDLVDLGQAGEIHLAGHGLARGYLSRAALTAERFVPNRYGAGRLYRTGDLGRWRSDGEVEYLGRIDHQVKIRGNRVELGEVEAAVESHPAVRGAVASVNSRGQLVCHVTANGTAPDPGGVREWTARTLPDYMVPSAVVVLADFPLTSNGKVDRGALPEPSAAVNRAVRCPESAAEAALAEVWRELLGTSRVDLDDDLFESGADSITALRIAAGVRRLGYVIEAGAVLTSRTVERIAARMTPAVSPVHLPAPPGPAEDQPEGVEDTYPLTPMQAGMLFHSRSDPASRNYFQQSLLRFAGQANAEHLVTALQITVDRHPVLRTVFGLEDPQGLRQIVLRSSALETQMLDWRGAAPNEQADRLSRLLAEDLARGFPDLDTRPPLRVTVAMLADDRIEVLLSYHHALLDGWSLALLTNEVMVGYRALCSGGRPEFPEPVPFRRYVDHLAALDATAPEAYWHQYLSHCRGPTSPRLVQGLPDPASANAEATEGVSTSVRREDMAVLRRTAAAHGLTISSVMHGCWAALLSHYSGEIDVVFGSTVSGRPADLVGSVEIIGTCINTVPVRVRWSANTPLSGCMTGIQREMFERGPQELLSLAEIQQQAPLPKGTSLLDSIVVVENYPRTDDELSVSETLERTGYPLVLVVEEHNGALTVRLRYQTTRCSGAAARDLLADLVTIVRRFAVAPETILADLCLVTPDRNIAPRVDPTATFDGSLTAHRLFEAQAARVPQAVAVSSATGTLSYAQLNARANQIAHLLRDRGVGRGSFVGVLLHRSADLIAALLGVLKAGAAYIPLAPSDPRQRLRTIAEDADLACMLSEAALTDLTTDVDCPVLLIEDVHLGLMPQTNPALTLVAADVAYMIYTSGSTGRPKGVACHHAGLANYLRHSTRAYAGTTGGGAPLMSSVAFDMVVTTLYTPLALGQPICLIPEEVDAGGLGTALTAQAPFSFVKLTPGHLELLVDQLTPTQAAGLADLLVVGGEAFSTRLLKRWRALAPDTVVFNEYGPTEGTVGNVVFQAGDPPAARELPIGRPIDGTAVHVLDRWWNPVPPGMVGEIYLGGACCARGYPTQAGQTAERFLPDPFARHPGARMYRTGDFGRWSTDGTLEFLGRADDQVKVRGYRVEPAEVAACLEEHPAVTRAVVLAQRTRLVAVVTTSGTEDGHDLSAWLRSRLPAYMVPGWIRRLDSMPLTRNGKVDFASLPATADVDERSADADRPRDEIETKLCAVWQEVLGIGRVGRSGNFFELGGDSILTLKVVSVARGYGLKLTSNLLFRCPTVAELAPFVTVACDVQTTALLPHSAISDIPLTPIQRWFLDLDLPDPHHFNQSVVLTFDTLDLDRVRHALYELVRRHDALRLRFHRDSAGWHQHVATIREGNLLEVVDLVDEQSQREQADRVQAMLDLESGSLIAACAFRAPQSGPVRLLIAVHHLAVDTLSWPVLLSDLARAYRGELLGPPPVSFASCAQVSSEMPPSGGASTALSVNPGTQGEAVTHRVRLDPEPTRALLHDIPARRLRVEDVLVTVLVLVMTENKKDVTIDVERHGRDLFGNELDVSGTVGWFTAVYPLVFSPRGGPADTLLEVKERLRALRGPGSAVQGGQIVLNYHGRLAASDGGWPFRRMPGTLGAEKSAAQPRTHLVEIEAGVQDGRLELEWIHAPSAVPETVVRELADRYLLVLAGLIDECRQGGDRYTPSDFPLAEPAQADIMELVASEIGEIEDIYPLNPMQSAMVMHTLLSADEGVYLEQQRYKLTGLVDSTVFVAAWRDATARHPAMRSVVRWELSTGPAQVVLRHGELDVRTVQATGDEWEALLRAERAVGFDFSAGPPIRLTVAERNAGELDVVFTFHHVLLDGWSVSVLLEEVMQRYDARLRGDTAVPTVSSALRRCIEAMLTLDTTDAREFWRRELDGLSNVTRLPAATGAGTGTAHVELTLDPDETRQLKRAATARGLTLSTLAHAAWALLLARTSDAHDVLFGSVVSGRTADVPGADEAVGMLMNTLPLRVEVDLEAPLGTWLAAVQRNHARIRDYEHSSLVDIAAWHEWPSRIPLFDSILAVENIPHRGLRGERATLSLVDSTDNTDYPVTMIVYDNEPLSFRLAYQRAYCDDAAARRLLDALALLLREFSRDMDRSVGEAAVAAGMPASGVQVAP